MQHRKTALITGITGQDGSYLAELLLAKGYTVHGIKRRSSQFNTARVDHLYQDPHEPDVRLRLIHGDLSDASSVNQILKQVRPDEIYNLAAQSHVRVSFDMPEYTGEVDALGTTRILEAISAPEPADVLRALAGETASIITLARMAHDQDKSGRRALREENAAVSRGDIDPFGPEAGNLETLL